MKTLEEEALSYAMTKGEVNPEAFTDEQIGRLHGYIDGVKSKWVQAENIKNQMSLLSNLRCSYDDTYYIDLEYDKLEGQLKELEDAE